MHGVKASSIFEMRKALRTQCACARHMGALRYKLAHKPQTHSYHLGLKHDTRSYKTLTAILVNPFSYKALTPSLGLQTAQSRYYLSTIDRKVCTVSRQ